MVDKIRTYKDFSYDFYNDKNCIFHGNYYKVRRINQLRYGIKLYKIW
jgi:hypothetical protein